MTSIDDTKDRDRKKNKQRQIEAWNELGPQEQSRELNAASERETALLPETLLHICREAVANADGIILGLAFNALGRKLTPQLLHDAFGLSPVEKKDQARDILLDILEEIICGQRSYLDENPRAYCKRRSIDRYRKRRNTIEYSSQRMEPSPDLDPIEAVPDRLPTTESKALLRHSMKKIPERNRTIFIEYHVYGFDQKEISKRHRISVRTVYRILSEAATMLGAHGERNDR